MNSLHQLQRLSDRIYWLPPDERTDRPVLGVICGEKHSLIVDAGNSVTHAEILLREISRHNLVPPQFVALTHWHWDHVFGNEAFNVPIIAHYETLSQVAKMARLDWSDAALDARVKAGEEIEFCRDMIKVEFPESDRSRIVIKVPEITFYTQLNVDLGGVTAQIIHVGGDHSADSTVIFVPEERVVFLGDCTGSGVYDTWQYTTRRFFPLLDRLLDFDAQWYFHGHDAEPESAAAFRTYVERTKLIGATAEQFGHQREAIIAELDRILGEPHSNWDLEDLDAFLRGLGQI